MKRLYSILVLMLLLGLVGLGQSTPSERYQNEALPTNAIDHNRWDQLSNELDYSRDQALPKPEKQERDDSVSPTGADFGSFFELIGYIILALGIAFILYLLLRTSGPRNRKISKTDISDPISLDNIEENLERADVDAFIERAIAEGDYQMAIRLHFLATLKALSLAGHLKWKKDKTNRVYLREMQHHPQRADFRRLVQTFERVWYGRMWPSKTQYESWSSWFRQFRQQLPIVQSLEN